MTEREAFENWWVDFHNGRQIACDYVEEDNSYAVGYANAQWVAWQAAKAQAVQASINDIQSWIAVNSFSDLDVVHDNVQIVDANELAKYIDSLSLSVSVPEGYVLVKKELPEQIAEEMAIDRVDKPRHENDSVWREIAEKAYRDQIQFKKWELWRDYKAMIEAVQESK